MKKQQKNLILTIGAFLLIVVVGVVVFSGQSEPVDTEEDTNAQATEQPTTRTLPTSPTSVSPPQNTPSTKTSEVSSGATLIRYTSGGFVPDIAEIRRGQTLAFRNDTNKELLVTTQNVNLTQQAYAFPNSPVLLQGETWEFTVTAIADTYSFVNDYNENHIGVLVVQPQ